MTQWDTTDAMVGERVTITTIYGEHEPATVIAIHPTQTLIKVRAADGDVLIGNQWE